MRDHLENEFVQMLQVNKEVFYRLAYSFVGNEQDALDVISEAVFKGLKGLTKVREPDYLKTWFYRIVINESKRYFKQNKQVVVDHKEMEKHMGHLRVDHREDVMDLYIAINALPEKYRTVIVLRYLQDLPFDEIGLVLKTNVNTVKTRHKRALASLEKSLGGAAYA